MLRMDPAALRKSLEQLEQAVHDHAHWQENLIRSIVCRLPCDPNDLEDRAHRQCRFGQWYYEQAPVELWEQPAFVAIEVEHKRLHQVAAQMLREATTGVPVAREVYDDFVIGGERLHLELDSLRHALAGSLRDRDALTGAYGRVEMLPTLREWRELARRNVQHCCIAFMDLDHLKEINDTHGHVVGDQVLAGVVRHVMEHLRPYDKVFRYGGDEFLISLPGADLEIGRKVIGHIREQIAGATAVASPAGHPIATTASFGLALLEPDISVEESIDRADKALLVAKAAGRNRVCSWDPAVTTGTVLQRMMEDGAAG
ncbi:MAG: diguanylate cyclase [Steroidobacteraceae bacterium]|nr:diguanylate cyclase [Steroidobacteraceae bacterium]MBP9129572.1 diguanylate cyclase [Steroidobacteraceae bacterium]